MTEFEMIYTHSILCMNWLRTVFGIEQEDGSLITLMALAQPLHPIRCKSRNKGETCGSDAVFPPTILVLFHMLNLLSGVPDYFYRNKISSGGDLSHYSSASLY